MNHLLFPQRCAAVLALLALLFTGGVGAADPAGPQLRPAERVAHAATAMLLAGARAGQRLVLVGDHGVVLLSDDDGRSWRQAQSVPADAMLTAVSFVDARHGWAVGHWGIVLHTDDGGETWQLQRQETSEDRPLFGVHFLDARHGVAVGLWSLLLRTADGGATWQPQTLPPPAGASRADLNLYGLLADAAGNLYAPSERGLVLRSSDGGASWAYLATGFKGSLWTGAALPDGSLLIGGLRGAIYRSADQGATWSRAESATAASIVGLAWRAGEVVGVTTDGGVLSSRDGGAVFAPGRRAEAALTGVVIAADGRVVLLSRQGPVEPR